MFQFNAKGELPTPAQVVHNCNLAEKLWRERVQVDNVNLQQWVSTQALPPGHCGRIACFGGHLASWPEFMQISGAGTRSYGAPVVIIPRDDGGPNSEIDAEELLFGNDWIFDTRNMSEDSDDEPDYEIVLQRIARCRELAQQGKLGAQPVYENPT
jgi:hypothetical protein